LTCDLVVCFVTPTHFREDNWLVPIVGAFEKYGDGLYGASASYQNLPHIRTGCLACSPNSMREYPRLVDSRETGLLFESGESPTRVAPEWCFTNWMMDRGRPVKMVTREVCYDLAYWRKPDNIFRRGDQGNVLVWDRHCDIFDSASPEEKRVLESLADGSGGH
jgi:hypothetical protein